MMAWPAVRRLVLWREYPSAFQMILLGLLLAMAVVGWDLRTPEGIPPKLYAKTNMVSLFVWGLWWPSIVGATVLLGRVWCSVCPLEWVSTRAETLRGRLGLPGARLPRRLAAGWAALTLYILLQWLVPAIAIHRVPHYTSVYLLLVLSLAFACGLAYRDRAFCRGFCPVAPLLNAYGRGGMLAVRPKDGAPGAPGVEACRSLLNPSRLNSSRHCLMCAECLKADPERAMEWRLRPPFPAEDARESRATGPLTIFVVIVSGFIVSQLCTLWKPAEHLFEIPPERLAGALGLSGATGWFRGAWMLIVVPLLLWIPLGLLARIRTGWSLGESWRRLALPMAMVAAAGHLAKGVEKMTSWAGFTPYAWVEPSGIATSTAMHAKTLAQPAAWMSAPAVAATALALIALGAAAAIREARRADAGAARHLVAPILLLSALHAFIAAGSGGWIP